MAKTPGMCPKGNTCSLLMPALLNCCHALQEITNMSNNQRLPVMMVKHSVALTNKMSYVAYFRELPCKISGSVFDCESDAGLYVNLCSCLVESKGKPQVTDGQVLAVKVKVRVMLAFRNLASRCLQTALFQMS